MAENTLGLLLALKRVVLRLRSMIFLRQTILKIPYGFFYRLFFGLEWRWLALALTANHFQICNLALGNVEISRKPDFDI